MQNTTTMYLGRYGHGDRRIYFGLPGFGAPHEKSFGHIIDRLPEDVTLYGVDPPGIGKSPQPAQWEWATITDHLLDALYEAVEAEGRPLTLMGACSGSFHALEMARQAPDAVDELILIEPFSYFPWFVRLLIMPGVGAGLLRSTFGSDIGRVVIQQGLTMFGLTGGFDTMSSFANIHWRDLHRYLKIYGMLEARGPIPYAGLTMPKRVYYGTKTFDAVLNSLKIWEGLWEDVELFELQDVGHQVTQEAPDKLVELLFTALRRTVPPAVLGIDAHVTS